MGPLEFHGAHLPVGLDPIVAHNLCLRTALQTGGVVLPPFWHGTGGEHGMYPFSMLLPAAVLEPLIRMSLHQIRGWNGRVAVLFSGHMAHEQCAMLRELAISESTSTFKVLALSAADWTRNPMKPDHAGLFETTLLGALRPELVHLEHLPAKSVIRVESNPFGRQRHEATHPLHGIFGPDPRNYDATSASTVTDQLVGWLSTTVSATYHGILETR
jgi:creatinine amidohydrolase